MRLLLGSSSRGRRAVMQRLGVPFETTAADIDERAVFAAGAGRELADPAALTRAVARAKADAIVARLRAESPEQVVAGAACLLPPPAAVRLTPSLHQLPHRPRPPLVAPA